MKLTVTTLDAKKDAEITLSDAVFGADVRKDILHRVVNWQLAKRQAGTHKTKTRSEVTGTTKKPFKQKGTGSARQGSLKGPHMVGGGKAHGPLARSHGHDLPKKIRQLGMRSALSLKAAEGKLVILKDTKLKDGKTKELKASMQALGLTSALIVDGAAVDVAFKRAASNLIHVDVLPQVGANVYDILRHDVLVLTVDAVKALETRLA